MGIMKLLNPEIDAATAAAFGSLNAGGQYGSTTTSSGGYGSTSTSSGYGSTSTSSGPASSSVGTVSTSSGYGATSASGAAAAAAGEANVGPYGPYGFAGSPRRETRDPYLSLQSYPQLPNYPTTIHTYPTNQLPSRSFKFLQALGKPRAASPCPARCVPLPLSRFAARCLVPR